MCRVVEIRTLRLTYDVCVYYPLVRQWNSESLAESREGAAVQGIRVGRYGHACAAFTIFIPSRRIKPSADTRLFENVCECSDNGVHAFRQCCAPFKSVNYPPGKIESRPDVGSDSNSPWEQLFSAASRDKTFFCLLSKRGSKEVTWTAAWVIILHRESYD